MPVKGRTMDEKRKFRIKKHVLWKKVDDEVVIVDPEKDDYSYLNHTGTLVWELIDGGLSVGMIRDKLKKKFKGSVPKMEKDIVQLIDSLHKKALIEEA